MFPVISISLVGVVSVAAWRLPLQGMPETALMAIWGGTLLLIAQWARQHSTSEQPTHEARAPRQHPVRTARELKTQIQQA